MKPSLQFEREAARSPIQSPIFVGEGMRQVLECANDVAEASTTVLLLGESGTGKEVVARYIHRESARNAGPWVAVNCAALPAEILESELFGHERGAFTGATDRRIGKIEQADGGTLLLDEVSEMPLPLQAKLLRVLQEREVDRVGGTRPQPVDVRIIATSNRDLQEMVRHRQFRGDLYYRLCVFPIILPPLRERSEDIPALAEHFLCRFAEEMGRPVPTLTPAAMSALCGYPFPGNVRELGNLVERVMVRCRSEVVDVAHLGPLAAVGLKSIALDGLPACTIPINAAVAPTLLAFPDSLPIDLTALERLAIHEALRRVKGNRTHAARMLGISLRTLRNKLRLWREAAHGPEHFADGQEFPSNDDGELTTPDAGLEADLAHSSQGHQLAASHRAA